MPAERITLHRTNVDKTELIEQYPKTIVGQVYDIENSKFLDETLIDFKNKIKNVISLEDFKRFKVGDDDSTVFNAAISYCYDRLGTSEEISHIKIPGGLYKCYTQITTYPQVKLVADGAATIESYIVDGSLFYLRYPPNKTLGSDYRGHPISGGPYGISIINKKKVGVGADATYGGNNICLDLGTRIADDNEFSESRMVSRYFLDNILIDGFATAIRINNISHFMGHYSNIRILGSDTCVQIGEILGQDLATSIENFSFTSCLFEGANFVFKWVRNGVGVTFQNCSFDYNRGHLLYFASGGQRRIIFNGCHIEKVGGYISFFDYVTTYQGTAATISFTGTELHLSYKQLFKTINAKVRVSFDEGCTYVRDEYIYYNYQTPFGAINRPLGDSNVYFDKISYKVFHNNGIPTTGVSAITNYDFSLTPNGSLIGTDANFISGFSNKTNVTTPNIFSITELEELIPGWNISKQLNYQMNQAENVTYANFELTTNKIRNKTDAITFGFLVKSNSYATSSIQITLRSYDYNDILLDTETFLISQNEVWGTLPINQWNYFNPLEFTGAYLMPKNTDYNTISFKLNTSNKNAQYAFTALTAEYV